MGAYVCNPSSAEMEDHEFWKSYIARLCLKKKKIGVK